MPIFDPERIHDIARNAVAGAPAGADPDLLLDLVTDELVKAYPGHIDDGPRKWIFSAAGGNLGQMAILQASMNEYVLFFGAPLATGGHSGRYRINIWDAVLAGEMHTWKEGQLEPVIHRPGSINRLGPGDAHGYRVSDGTWLLEYGRGPIASALPFALADVLFSSLDFQTLGKTMWRYSELMLRGLRRPRR